MRGNGLAPDVKFRTFIMRLGWLICALLSLSLSVVGADSLFADLYTSLSEHQRARYFASSVALQSAGLATRMAPWKAKAWREYASSASQSGQTDLAMSAVSQAIYWMPSDAEGWAVLSRVLIASARFDHQLKLATSLIYKLGPNSPQWQREIAFDGLILWRYGDTELREKWLEGMHDSYINEKDAFLVSVVQAHRESDLCEYAGKALKLDKWCEWAAYTRSICALKTITLEQRNFCSAVGFTAADKP